MLVVTCLLLVARIVMVWLFMALIWAILALQWNRILRPLVVVVTVSGIVRTLFPGKHILVIELTHVTMVQTVRVLHGDSFVHTVRNEKICLA